MSAFVFPRAERRPARKVDRALVALITDRLDAGQSQQSVARELGVSQNLVWRVSKLREVRP